MPFSDTPPAFVFPDTEDGRERLRKFVAEEPILLGKVATCDQYQEARHPVYTDDDLYSDAEVRRCGHRNRMGVRDMNWCCRCIAGFPHTWLDARDVDGLSDRCATAL